MLISRGEMADVCVVSFPLGNAPSASRSCKGSHGFPVAGRLPPLPAIAQQGPSMTTSNKMVVVKVTPSFTSSDLFTPFGPARETLPSIAEFVRPSYGQDNTWGTPTTMYGGGGNISRSHKHLGTGCINFHAPSQPRRVTALQPSQCRPSDQILPKPLLTDQVVNKQMQCDLPRQDKYMSHQSQFAVFPSHIPNQRNSTSGESEAVQVLTTETMRALSNIHTHLYAQSTTKRDFQHKSSSPESAKNEEKHQQTGQEDCMEVSAEEEQCPQDDECSDVQGQADREDNHACPCDNELEDKENHMTLLPGHVIITHVSELPDHFRRITTKYTRNPNSLVPCMIPCHLLRKPSLLLPHGVNQEGVVLLKEGGVSVKEDGLRKEKENFKGCHKLAPLETNASNGPDTSFLEGPRPKSNIKLNCKSHTLPPVVGTLAPPPTPLTASQGPPLTLPEVTNTRLGPVGFKTQAHARYHSVHPDNVPDLRASHVKTKKVWFHGYHASVFRGC